ncbi:MAG: hypothetical protein M3081_14495 [Gemmatimonadota bacterium]|nr:hypothetical protein [Gemmatimonadota bacterium]
MSLPFPWSRIIINGMMWFTMGVWASVLLDEWRTTPGWKLALMFGAAGVLLAAYSWLLVAGIRGWAASRGAIIEDVAPTAIPETT